MQVYRLINDRNTALQVLDGLLAKVRNEDAPYVEGVRCLIESEKKVQDKTLTLTAFFDRVRNSCPYTGTTASKRNTGEENEEEMMQREEINYPLQIRPNPARQNLHIISGNEGEQQIRVYNVMGQHLYTQTFTTRLQIDVSKWGEGIYMFEVTDLDSGKQRMQKVLVH